MTDRTLHDLTADELIELLADLERVQVKAEELLLGRRAQTKKPGNVAGSVRSPC